MGVTTAIDDFGAGHAGLGLLAKFQTDLIKLDMDLIRSVDQRETRWIIVSGVVAIAKALGIAAIAIGVETAAQCKVVRKIGICYRQGYLLARPGFKSLPIALPLAEAFSVDALRKVCEPKSTSAPQSNLLAVPVIRIFRSVLAPPPATAPAAIRGRRAANPFVASSCRAMTRPGHCSVAVSRGRSRA